MSEKLDILARIAGFEDIEDMLTCVGMESIVPGICKNEGCSYSTDVEPDACGVNAGWCEECQEASVESCLGLAGII